MADEKLSEVEKFWKKREEKLGAKIEFYSYATLIGECGSGKMNGRGGLFYVVADRVYFEDFERQNALMAMFNRKDSDYEKTEISFLLSDIKSMRKISEKWGKACISEGSLSEKIPELKGFMTFFTRGYSIIFLKDRSPLVLEIMEDEAFKKYIPDN
ncbi:hypothetical protein [Oceanispirochaeta sp.]|jgi:hypothetical protein|uniref:hypothetical protein n=1 Tax=Oceanispirochaeta sp. TaxID=2035350 RepID=UPI0026055393|nr:hypothetical protein [Oceanispirochaeta sp.]MDA3959023.1 hypothetical protein [Oceanispirochaeta sp.]